MYEVLNIRSLKQATPNLSVINLWGVSFVDDSHVEAFSSNCIQLAALSLNFCTKVKVRIVYIRQELCSFFQYICRIFFISKGYYFSGKQSENPSSKM